MTASRSTSSGTASHRDPDRSLEEVALLMAMSVSEQMPLADVKNRLSEVVDRLEREHSRAVITKHGHPAAVVISVTTAVSRPLWPSSTAPTFTGRVNSEPGGRNAGV